MSRQPEDLELFTANNHMLVRKVDIKNQLNDNSQSYKSVFDILDYPTLLGKVDRDVFIGNLLTELYDQWKYSLTRRMGAQLLKEQLGNFTKAIEIILEDRPMSNDNDTANKIKLKAFKFNFIDMVMSITNRIMKQRIIKNKDLTPFCDDILNMVEKAWAALCKYPSSSVEMDAMATTCIITLTYLVSSDEQTINHIASPLISFIVKLLKQGGGNANNKMMPTYQQQLYEILWRITTAYPTAVFNELLVNDSLESFLVNFKFPCKNYYNNLLIMFDLLCCTKDILVILRNATTTLLLQVNLINTTALDDLVMIKVAVLTTLMTVSALNLSRTMASHVDSHALLSLIVDTKGKLISLNKTSERDTSFLENVSFLIFDALLEEDWRVWVNLVRSDRCVPFLLMYAEYKKETRGPSSYSDVIYILNKIVNYGRHLFTNTKKRDSIQIASRYDELFKHYEAEYKQSIKDLKNAISEIKTVSVDDDVEIIVTNEEAEAMQRNKRKIEAPVVEEDPAPANKKQKSDAGMECIICMEENKSVVFFPCGHIVYCQKCNKKTKEKICPICRAIIKSKRKCYI